MRVVSSANRSGHLRPHQVVPRQQAASQHELLRERRGTRRQVVLRADDALRPVHERVRLSLFRLEGHGRERLLDPGGQLRARAPRAAPRRRERDRVHHERIPEMQERGLRKVRFAR